MFLLLIGVLGIATVKKQPIPAGTSVSLVSLEIKGVDQKFNCVSGYCEVKYTELRATTADGKLFTDITWPTTLPKIYIAEGIVNSKKGAASFVFELNRDGITKSIAAVNAFTEIKVE